VKVLKGAETKPQLPWSYQRRDHDWNCDKVSQNNSETQLNCFKDYSMQIDSNS
jgi:hypothetical protein